MLIALLGVAGCNRGESLVSAPDLGLPRDAAVATDDLAAFDDLSLPDDLAVPPDLVALDLVAVWDLAGPECIYGVPPLIDYGKVKVGACAMLPVAVGNKARCPVVKVQAGQIIVGPGLAAYDLVPKPPQPPFQLMPGVELHFQVIYCPSQPGIDLAELHFGEAQIALSGRGTP